MNNKKSTAFFVGLGIIVTLGLQATPAMANLEGGVTKDTFYDTEKTLMQETPVVKGFKTEKYWEKNLLYFNKYRPIFMLSNKELYDLMPKEHVSIVQRISTPSVYTISLKSSSVKKISLSPAVSTKNLTEHKSEKRKTPAVVQKQNDIYTSFYEQAKNPDTEPEKKIETAILLKNTKTVSNYNYALDLLGDVIEKEPYNAYAFYLKGEIYSAKKDSQNAMKNYVEALKINPTSKQCCLGIARILEPTNKQLAKKYYDKAK